MSYYGGTITVAGRDLITSLVAGETIEFTRIVVGSGAMPESVEPIDMTDLVTPVAEGTSTIPTVENGALYMTVEYRNDMNGGLKEGFWLREFGIYAKTAQSDEVLLYYATLGDSPQPVNAYQDNRIDIRRYPVTIALELDADVQVTYNPGSFITAAEARDLLSSLVTSAIREVSFIIIKDITIPASAWAEDVDCPGEYVADVAVEESTANHVANVALDKPSLEEASQASLLPLSETLAGLVRFRAGKAPKSDLTGTLALISPSASASTGGGGGYVLPAASSTTLGGVMVKPGSGLTVAGDGSLGLDVPSEAAVREAVSGEGETEG